MPDKKKAFTVSMMLKMVFMCFLNALMTVPLVEGVLFRGALALAIVSVLPLILWGIKLFLLRKKMWRKLSSKEQMRVAVLLLIAVVALLMAGQFVLFLALLVLAYSSNIIARYVETWWDLGKVVLASAIVCGLFVMTLPAA